MHFTTNTTSEQLMVEWIGVANGTCTLHGVCAYLGDNQEHLEGPPSIVPTPSVPMSATSSHSKEHFSGTSARRDPMQCVETTDGQFSQNVDVCTIRVNPMREVGTQAASSASGSKAVSVS